MPSTIIRKALVVLKTFSHHHHVRKALVVLETFSHHHHVWKKYSCDRCGLGYQTNCKDNLLRHIRIIHEGDEEFSKNAVHKCKETDGELCKK